MQENGDRLRSEKAEEYKRLRAAVWPDLLAMISRPPAPSSLSRLIDCLERPTIPPMPRRASRPPDALTPVMSRPRHLLTKRGVKAFASVEEAACPKHAVLDLAIPPANSLH